MNQRQKSSQLKNKRSRVKVRLDLQESDRILFCDLSSELDESMRFIACLGFESRSEQIQGYSHFLEVYLLRRNALEFVFFSRDLNVLKLDARELKAEVWRLQKKRAREKLLCS